MSVILRKLLITANLILLYSSLLMVKGQTPSIKDCKNSSGMIDCNSMGFLNIPYDIFSIPRKKILLGGNPFLCDCSLVWFLREPSENKARISDIYLMNCAYPEKLNKKPVFSLQESDICDTKLMSLNDVCFEDFIPGQLICRTSDISSFPFDVFYTQQKLDMEGEFICNCDVVWVIRRLKSKENQNRFLDHEKLLCKPFEKSEVLSPIIKFTENDVCPQKARDPCQAKPFPCPELASCVKTKTSFKCVDHNPCKDEKNPCPSTRKCEPIVLHASRQISYRCVDINECLSGDYHCEKGEECHNKENGYECRCKKDTRKVNGICIPIDPCERSPPVCDIKTQRCVSRNFQFYSCEDIDECLTQRHFCDENAKCVNTVPGYQCKCKPGFQLAKDGRRCLDFDECKTNNDPCGKNAFCVNEVGGYKCHCNEGYEYLYSGRLCLKKDEEDSGKTGLYIAIVSLVLISVLSIVLPVIGIYIQRKTRKEANEKDKNETDLLLPDAETAEQTLFTVDPYTNIGTKTPDDITEVLNSSDDEIDYDRNNYTYIEK